MKKIVVCFALALLAPVRVVAQVAPQTPAEDVSGLSFEELLQVEVVFAASKVEQKTSEAPSVVTIVTAEEIRTFGYRTLADILRGVRGFAVTNDRAYSYIGVRGFGRPGDYNTRVLLLVDGTPVNENVYGSVLGGEENLVDPAMIERVEIIRGAASSIHGSNAFFGVVNVITKGFATGSHAEAAAEAASRGTKRGRFRVGGAKFDISASIYDSDGGTLSFADLGTTSGTNDESAWRYLAKLDAGAVSLQAAGVRREKGVPTGSYGTVFDDPRTRNWDELHYLTLNWSRELAPGRFLKTRATAGRYTFEADYVFDAINRDEAVGEWINAEALLTMRRSNANTTIAGIEVQDDRKQVQRNFDIDPREVYLDVEESGRRYGAFLQHDVRLHPRVRATLGFRYDHYESFGGRISPRGALIVQTSPSSTLKVLAGDSFRAPTTYERVYENPPIQIANPELEPETIRSYEIAYERLLGSRSQLIASLFTNSLSNLIEFQEVGEDASLQFGNLGRVRSSGGEIELGTRWEKATLKTSYSYQKTTNEETDESLTNSPQHLIQSHLALRLPRDLSAGLEALYTSRRKTIGGGSTDPFTVLNGTFVVPLRRGLTVDASVYDLFDTRGWDPGSEEHLQEAIEQDGRTFRVRLTWAGAW